MGLGFSTQKTNAAAQNMEAAVPKNKTKNFALDEELSTVVPPENNMEAKTSTDNVVGGRRRTRRNKRKSRKSGKKHGRA
jgi:hypothetical protein